MFMNCLCIFLLYCYGPFLHVFQIKLYYYYKQIEFVLFVFDPTLFECSSKKTEYNENENGCGM